VIGEKILDAEYLIRKTMKEIKKIIDTSGAKTKDDNLAIRQLEILVEKLEDVENELKYLKADAKEGVLFLNSVSKRFVIKYNDGTESYDLTCGSSLEVWDNEYEEWNIGRVEHSTEKGYYFYQTKSKLTEGMRVAKRLIEN
jgi:hypothetical protein